MTPIQFPEQTKILAKNQPQYQPLPVHIEWDGKFTPVTSCWKLSFFERVKLLFTGKVWVKQLTFGNPLQPQLLQVEHPFENK